MTHPDPSGSAAEETRLEVVDPQAYLKKMEAALDGRDPLLIAGETVGQLEQIIQQHPSEILRSRPYTDRWTWTPLEIIGHLLDVEWTLGWRTRTVFCDDQPVITAMDQDKWVATQKHNQRLPEELVSQFAVLRAINLQLWSRIPQAEHNRTGRHAERGKESLGGMLRFYAGHDVYHLAQIDRYLAVIQATPS